MENSQNYYCTNCGKPMNEQAEFCTSCGVKQGKVINYCYNCGSTIEPNQEICLTCGVNPRKIKRTGTAGSAAAPVRTAGNSVVNPVLATIIGLFIPGLPSLIWFGQKTKGIVMIIAFLLGIFIIPIAGPWIVAIFGAIDAYQLSGRVNNGETLDEWTFFWNK